MHIVVADLKAQLRFILLFGTEQSGD